MLLNIFNGLDRHLQNVMRFHPLIYSFVRIGIDYVNTHTYFITNAYTMGYQCFKINIK